jgi:YidC/Oxa1 family membrane protein insertase
MDKRIFIAGALWILFMVIYTRLMPAPPGWSPTEPRPAPGASLAPAPAPTARLQPLPVESVATLEDERLAVDIGRETGAIRRIALKRFPRLENGGSVEFGGPVPILLFEAGGPLTVSELAQTSATSATVMMVDEQSNSYHISYALSDIKYLVNIVLQISAGKQSIPREISVLSAWTAADQLSGRSNVLEAYTISRKQDGRPKHKHFVGTAKDPRNVPRGTMALTLSERHFCQSIWYGQEAVGARLLPAPYDVLGAEASLGLPDDGRRELTLYVGPRDYFQMRESGMADAFPIGLVGHIGLTLLWALKLIAGITHNYGVAIIVFSGLITGMMAPFTILSFRSMRKMQALKPEVDRLMAKYKGDPQRANREVFALYKERRISPISGCLPMLFQIPIFIALFQAISHFIELRGQSFLWIRDLSLPDRLAQMPFSLPFLGQDVNVLPIIMAVAMFFQSRISQASMPTGDANPAAKIMSGPLMSVLFAVMFYQMPSSLVLYWLTNTLMSVLWYRLAR